MIYQVLANGVVTVQSECEFELGADPVDTRDKHRLLIFLNSESEESAKTANFAKHLGTMRRRKELRQGPFDLVAKIDVDTGPGIRFLFHLRGQIMGKRTVEPRLKWNKRQNHGGTES